MDWQSWVCLLRPALRGGLWRACQQSGGGGDNKRGHASPRAARWESLPAPPEPGQGGAGRGRTGGINRSCGEAAWLTVQARIPWFSFSDPLKRLITRHRAFCAYGGAFSTGSYPIPTTPRREVCSPCRQPQKDAGCACTRAPMGEPGWEGCCSASPSQGALPSSRLCAPHRDGLTQTPLSQLLEVNASRKQGENNTSCTDNQCPEPYGWMRCVLSNWKPPR